MKQCLFSHRRLGLGVVVAALFAVPAQAVAASVDTSACTTPEFSQPFLPFHDSNWYSLMPGQSVDNFDGNGWSLSGGAKIVTTTLADGSTGSVLDLPSGSKAVSPTICVTSDYPSARTFVRDVKGSEGVFFSVSYEGTKTWDSPRQTGQVHGNGTDWTPSDRANLQPSHSPGWQPVRITLIPGGKTSEFQIYNFYVDPRMRA